MTRRNLVIGLVLLASSLAPGDRSWAQQRMAPPDAKVSVTAENGVPEIAFRLVNHHVLIPVSVNGSGPLEVILDTGMPAPGLALYDGDRIEPLGLEINPAIQAAVGGAGGSKRLTAQVAMSESFAFDGVAVEGAMVVVLPRLGLDGYNDGVVGYSLFSNFAVELDYEKSLITLHDPAAFVPPDEALVLPLTFRQRVPYATVRVTPLVGEPFDADVAVDLGASHALSLNWDESERIEVPDGAVTTIIGRGASGVVKGQAGRIAALELAGARLENVVTSFPVREHQNPRGIDSLAGNLGNGALRRFNLVFDYAGEKLYLTPNASFSEEFRFDRSGLRLAVGQRLAVESVVAGSPADHAGLRVGDVVTRLNGTAVSGKEYGEAKQILMGDGTVEVEFERASESLTVSFELRQLI